LRKLCQLRQTAAPLRGRLGIDQCRVFRSHNDFIDPVIDFEYADHVASRKTLGFLRERRMSSTEQRQVSQISAARIRDPAEADT
jgi:hypothetical protein